MSFASEISNNFLWISQECYIHCQCGNHPLTVDDNSIYSRIGKMPKASAR